MSLDTSSPPEQEHPDSERHTLIAASIALLGALLWVCLIVLDGLRLSAFAACMLGASVLLSVGALIIRSIRLRSPEPISPTGSPLQLDQLLSDSITASVLESGDAPQRRWRGLILVVDDSDINQMIAKQMLGLLGFRCDAVGDGRLAVKTLFGETPYDVVLLDCQMPGMDGFETAREIRRREQRGDSNGRRTPIIALTALADDHNRCLVSGMDDIVTKPLDRTRLMQAIEPLLPKESKPAEQSPAPVPEEVEVAYAGAGEETPIVDSSPDQSIEEQLDEAASPIDVQRLLKQCMGHAAFAESVLCLFARNANDYLEKIERAVLAKDADALADAAQTLKGAADTLAANDLRDTATRLETLARAKETDDLEQTIATLREQLRQTQALIDNGISLEDSSKA